MITFVGIQNPWIVGQSLVYTSTGWTGYNTNTFVELGDKSGTTVINLSAGCYFNVNVASSITFNFVTGTTDVVNNVVLEIISGGSWATTYTDVKWDLGVPPVLTPTGIDVLSFYTRNNGNFWYGFLSGNDMK